MNTTDWSSQQHCFATALLDPHMAVPDFLRARAGASLADRFDVYRNNVHASLTDALQAAFPVTLRLVGEEFFRALAREFLRGSAPGALPRGAALHDYGAELPAFIRGYAPAASLPWLADIAALEHAWWQAYGAADAPIVPASALGGVQGEQLLALRMRLHPATRLIHSAHPVHSIWAAHQAEGEPPPPANWEPECALITRPEAAVQERCITPGQHAFLATLDTGATLEQAALAALSLDTAFDLGTILLLAIEAGAIQELYP